MDTILQYVVPAILGLIGGGIASLIAPWVHWGIEKRKIRLNNKIQMLNDVKSKLDEFNFDFHSFTVTTEYLRVRKYLSDELRNKLEFETRNKPIDEVNFGLPYPSTTDFHTDVLDELTALEIKWGIL